MATTQRGAAQTQRTRRQAADSIGPATRKTRTDGKGKPIRRPKPTIMTMRYELDRYDAEIYPLEELSAQTRRNLHTVTSARELITAILDGPSAVLNELTHAGVDRELVPWVSLALQQAMDDPLTIPEMTTAAAGALLANPPRTTDWVRAIRDGGPQTLESFCLAREIPVPDWLSKAAAPRNETPPPPDYAVLQLRFSEPARTRAQTNEALLKTVTETLGFLPHRLPAEAAAKAYVRAYREALARAFVLAVGPNFGTVVPIQFQMPTPLPHVVMLHEVTFGYEAKFDQITIDWVALPALTTPAEPAEPTK